MSQVFKFVYKTELFIIYGKVRKLVCNNFRPKFWAENHTDSFLAAAAQINVTSCNMQFIKQLLQCSPGWSQQYKIVCIQ